MKDLQEIKKALDIDDETTLYVVEELIKYIKSHYPKNQLKGFYNPSAGTMSKIPMAGGNPIDAVLSYPGEGHVFYSSLFLGPKVGYELTFRIASKKMKANQEFVNLFAQLANMALMSRIDISYNNYEVYDMKDWFGSDIRAIILLTDPILGTKELKIGDIRFVHIFGITENEYKKLSLASEEEIGEFIKQKLADNPMLITSENK